MEENQKPNLISPNEQQGYVFDASTDQHSQTASPSVIPISPEQYHQLQSQTVVIMSANDSNVHKPTMLSSAWFNSLSWKPIGGAFAGVALFAVSVGVLTLLEQKGVHTISKTPVAGKFGLPKKAAPQPTSSNNQVASNSSNSPSNQNVSNDISPQQEQVSVSGDTTPVTDPATIAKADPSGIDNITPATTEAQFNDILSEPEI